MKIENKAMKYIMTPYKRKGAYIVYKVHRKPSLQERIKRGYEKLRTKIHKH
jgi:hypothetical protein